jgi:hypothetical protein
MTPDHLDLARRAVACPRWRWMPGMLVAPILEDDTIEPVTGIIVSSHRLLLVYWPDVGLRWQATREHLLPDLTDPATLGCLLALAREAWGDPALYVRLSDTSRKSDGVRAWEVLGWLDPSRSPDGRGGSWRSWGHASEAEALVAALESAP